jgi:hypothetical protein
MSQRVFFHHHKGEPEFFGTVVEDATTLEKAQLLDLIEGYDLCIVQQPNGDYAVFDTTVKSYEVRDNGT